MPKPIVPGCRCIIVSEDALCEENIGATLTVTHLVEDEDEPNRRFWSFTDASRPLKFIDVDNRSFNHYSCESQAPYSDLYIWENYLVRIDDFTPEESLQVTNELEVC